MGQAEPGEARQEKSASAMNGLSLVTGANGHLGNNVVRALRARGYPVRARMRDLSTAGQLTDAGADLVQADLMDKASLVRALAGVDTLLQVAAVFRHWSRNPDRDIVVPNVAGTRNVLEAAAANIVRRVVYVSSIAALDRRSGSAGPVNERNWSVDDQSNPYFRSKTISELLAWRLSGELGLDMVSPSLRHGGLEPGPPHPVDAAAGQRAAGGIAGCS